METAKERGRVLITGAAGFSGHHMVMEAVEAGFQVRATDVSSRHYSAMFDALGVEFISADITRREGLDILFEDISGVIHVAGIHDYSTPDKMIFAVNVDGVKNVCDAAAKAGVRRFVHWSSVAVYGYDWHDGRPVNEDDAKLTPPLNNYNISKWQGEKVVRKYQREHDLPAVILRPAAIYGIRSEYGLANVFKQAYLDRNKKKMLMAGKGNCLEAFLHIKDMCRAAIFAYDKDTMIGEAYNVADDTHITTEEFFRFVCRYLLNQEKDFLKLPLWALSPVAVIAQAWARVSGGRSLLEKATLNYLNCDKYWDNSKIKTAGFQFAYPTMEAGMKETLEWYKKNGWFR
jgi:nucleoside-diphosphate-sugar epimerase